MKRWIIFAVLLFAMTIALSLQLKPAPKPAAPPLLISFEDQKGTPWIHASALMKDLLTKEQCAAALGYITDAAKIEKPKFEALVVKFLLPQEDMVVFTFEVEGNKTVCKVDNYDYLKNSGRYK